MHFHCEKLLARNRDRGLNLRLGAEDVKRTGVKKISRWFTPLLTCTMSKYDNC